MKFSTPQSLIHQFERSRQFYFIITDAGGQFLYSNSLFASRMTDIPEQLSGLSIAAIMAKEEVDKCLLAIEKCLQQDDNATVDCLCVGQKGIPVRIAWELSAANNEKGEPGHIQWIGIEEQNKTEENLQQSELFYRNLIADSLDGILLTDNLGVISFASASARKILGYEPEEVLHKNAFEFLHPDDRAEGMSAFFAEVQLAPVSKFINARIKQKSGQWLWCMVRGHNLLANPYIGAMLIYFCDDTLRKNAETALIESEQRFRHLIHNLNLGVLLMNGKGQVLVSNEIACELLGVTARQLAGKIIFDNDWDVIHEDGSPFSPTEYPIAIAIRTSGSVRDILMGIHKVGNPERVWLTVNAEVVMDDKGTILYTICSFTDITEQKRLAQQLMGQEIQKQKQVVQATIDGQERERREIGRELHDNISQHLTTTRLYLEVAREKAEGEMLEMINQAHKGLLDMINEIRHLSQSLIPPSLSDIGLVESIQDLCNPLKKTHAFQIDFQYAQFNENFLPENMKLMLFRIIQEQVNNIIRHAHAHTIQIRLRSGEDGIVLSIADDGRGFDPRTVKKGLGFDNMSNRADLFGGRVRVEAAPGKGCFVEVIVPQTP